MYTISDYGGMIVGNKRTSAYAEALRCSVKPGSVVLDIGTGPGIWALLACRLGARKVYAIEPDDVIELARELAAVNGYMERIEFIKDLSTSVRLPERVDMIVSDLRGVLPLYRQSVLSIVDARERFLKDDGVLIPRRDTLWAAVVTAPDTYRSRVSPWDEAPFGIEMHTASRFVVNTWWKAHFVPDQFLAEPQCWASLDYATITSPNVDGQVSWTATHTGTAHGLSVWFDAELTAEAHLSNSPGQPEVIYGSAFFPWSTPVALSVGDMISVNIRANLVGQDYVWCWNTCVLDNGLPQKIKASFKQSTFLGAPLSPSQLQKLAANYEPALNEEGNIDQFVVSLMDGTTSLGEIARRVSKRFPTRFVSWNEALTHVGVLSEKYSR